MSPTILVCSDCAFIYSFLRLFFYQVINLSKFLHHLSIHTPSFNCFLPRLKGHLLLLHCIFYLIIPHTSSAFTSKQFFNEHQSLSMSSSFPTTTKSASTFSLNTI